MIIGTAGHVDHGKTSLVRALTGVDTDRLAEEKRRGISIELGFAYLPVPGGGVLGLVDVPGHERFVHTMLAGAAGIDLALLVVAADDGPMPQTREHLQILELLGIPRLLVALSKADLVDAPALAAAAAAVRAMLAGTPFAGADLLPVSATTGLGLEVLRGRLFAEAQRPSRARGQGAFRFAVDRSFVLPGAGVIATGTALSGRIATGGAVTLLPRGVDARVRSLHVQNRPATLGQAGERCALNLAGAGIERDGVRRGDWLLDPACAVATTRLDAEVTLLDGEPHPLRQGAALLLHLGASRVEARVVRLGAAALAPGGRGLAQLVLGAPLPARCGDRFVLREPAAQRTMGGGRVLDASPPARRRGAGPRLAVLEALRALPADALPPTTLAALLALPPGFVALDGFCRDRGMDAAQAAGLLAHPGIVVLQAGGQPHAVERQCWAALGRRVVAALGGHHAANPDLPGPTMAELRTLLTPDGTLQHWPVPIYAAALRWLAQDGLLVLQSPWVRLSGHVPRLSAAEARLWEGARTLLAADRFRPPRVRDLSQALAAPEPAMRLLCKRMARQGELSEVAPDHFFLRGTVAEMAGIAAALSEAGAFTAAQFRDRLDNGRKVAIQILEFFDRRGLTLRQADLRQVVKEPAELFGSG